MSFFFQQFPNWLLNFGSLWRRTFWSGWPNVPQCLWGLALGLQKQHGGRPRTHPRIFLSSWLENFNFFLYLAAFICTLYSVDSSNFFTYIMKRSQNISDWSQDRRQKVRWFFSFKEKERTFTALFLKFFITLNFINNKEARNFRQINRERGCSKRNKKTDL